MTDPGAANSQGEGQQPSTSASANSQGEGRQPNNQDTAQYSQGEEETISPTHARDLRRENASMRKRLQEIETASMSEQQKQEQAFRSLQEEHSQLLVEVQQSRLMTEVAKHAGSLGFLDAETVATLLQAGGKLETDDKGKYTNVTQLMKDLAKDKPFLVSSATQGQPAASTAPNRGTGGGTTNPAAGSSKEPLSWEYIQRIGRENPAEYNERRAEIQAWFQRQNFR